MQLEELQREVETAKKLMDEIISAGVDFEMARVLLVSKHHITMGEATDRLLLYERITGKQLQR